MWMVLSMMPVVTHSSLLNFLLPCMRMRFQLTGMALVSLLKKVLVSLRPRESLGYFRASSWLVSQCPISTWLVSLLKLLHRHAIVLRSLEEKPGGGVKGSPL